MFCPVPNPGKLGSKSRVGIQYTWQRLFGHMQRGDEGSRVQLWCMWMWPWPNNQSLSACSSSSPRAQVGSPSWRGLLHPVCQSRCSCPTQSHAVEPMMLGVIIARSSHCSGVIFWGVRGRQEVVEISGRLILSCYKGRVKWHTTLSSQNRVFTLRILLKNSVMSCEVQPWVRLCLSCWSEDQLLK